MFYISQTDDWPSTNFFICFIDFLFFCQSQPVFTDVTVDAGINHSFRVHTDLFGGGVVVFDYNQDGFEDLFIAGGVGPDRLYKNNRDGTFTDVASDAGLGLNSTMVTQGGVSADVNHDGFTDLFVTTIAGFFNGQEIFRAPDILYLNNGNGTFSDGTQQFNLDRLLTFSTGATFGDINADGYPELFVGNYFDFFEGDISQLTPSIISDLTRPSKDHFYLNNFGSNFTEITNEYDIIHEGFGFGGAFTDYDNDDDMDLYVVNDFGNRASPNRLYKNEYPGLQLVKVSEEMKVDFGFNAMGAKTG
ncbi:MAG: VCBS repeat-containing protein, partial [Cyclobacteriaceae bacterium]|nr:VCBS repeat-containing protein [Cyclobacteriaceae bacterium]